VARVPAGLAGQLAQEKPLEQLAAAGQPSFGPEEALEKVDNWRSTLSLLHFGQRTPSALAPMGCRRENSFPQSPH